MRTTARFAPFLLTTTLLIAGGGCDEESERFEHLQKLRALGVATSPVIGVPSTPAAPQPVSFTVYASVPPGATVTAEPMTEDRATGSATIPLLPLTLVADSESYEDHPTFRIYSVRLTGASPSSELLPVNPALAYARIRYGIRLTTGTEEEKIIGTFLVYPADAREQAWAATPPAVAITAPVEGSTISSQSELKAAITNPIGEAMRVGWYVHKGKIKNRTAKETEWEGSEGGPQSIIVTARGRSSGAFAMKVVDVTVQ